MTGSLAYRKNETAILSGKVPEKYTRLLPYIGGERVFEVGAAEGVLALLMAQSKQAVTALEMRKERHRQSFGLHDAWKGRFGFLCAPEFVCGNIADNLHRLAGHDTFVAVRTIYYFRQRMDEIFSAVAANIENVTLCGNKNRAAGFFAGTNDDSLGDFNYYASAEGMQDVLTRHGYEIMTVVEDGDPIVVGRR